MSSFDEYLFIVFSANKTGEVGPFPTYSVARSRSRSNLRCNASVVRSNRFSRSITSYKRRNKSIIDIYSIAIVEKFCEYLYFNVPNLVVSFARTAAAFVQRPRRRIVPTTFAKSFGMIVLPFLQGKSHSSLSRRRFRFVREGKKDR